MKRPVLAPGQIERNRGRLRGRVRDLDYIVCVGQKIGNVCRRSGYGAGRSNVHRIHMVLLDQHCQAGLSRYQRSHSYISTVAPIDFRLDSTRISIALSALFRGLRAVNLAMLRRCNGP